MTVLEIVLLIGFGISAMGNVFWALFGIKIENNQTQIVESYNVNENHNENINLANTTLLLTNTTLVFSVSNGKTNWIMKFNLSTNNHYKISQNFAVTNKTNYTKLGLINR